MGEPSRLTCPSPQKITVACPLKNKGNSLASPEREGRGGYVVGVELLVAGVGANTRIVPATVAVMVARLGPPAVLRSMVSGSEEGSYLRRIDFCITQL